MKLALGPTSMYRVMLQSALRVWLAPTLKIADCGSVRGIASPGSTFKVKVPGDSGRG